MPLAAEIKAPPALKAKLRKLGLFRGSDLVLHLTLRYEDETKITPIAQALGDCPVQVEIEVQEISVQFRPRRQLVVRGTDASDTLTLRFLNFYGSQTQQFERARDEKRRLRVFGDENGASPLSRPQGRRRPARCAYPGLSGNGRGVASPFAEIHRLGAE